MCLSVTVLAYSAKRPFVGEAVMNEGDEYSPHSLGGPIALDFLRGAKSEVRRVSVGLSQSIANGV